jgi:hypothetical protein
MSSPETLCEENSLEGLLSSRLELLEYQALIWTLTFNIFFCFGSVMNISILYDDLWQETKR